MLLSQVQSTAQSLLASDALVGSFAPVLIADGINDLSSSIDSAHHSKGACIVLSDAFGGEADNSPVQPIAKARFYVFVYDNPRVTHTPGSSALVDAVISALTRKHAFQLMQWEKLQNDKGGTLTICEFYASIVFTG